jgi:hypothetical protein
LPCDVPNAKETPRIDAAAPENKRAIHVRQTAGTNVQPTAREHTILNRHVIKVLLFYGSAGLDLDQTPAPVPAAMEDINAHQHSVMFEHSLEDCGDFTVGDQLSRGADRLVETTFAADFDPTRKQLAGKHADFVPLLHDCLIGSIRLRCEFWLVNLPVKPFDTLATCNKLGFGDFHAFLVSPSRSCDLRLEIPIPVVRKLFDIDVKVSFNEGYRLGLLAQTGLSCPSLRKETCISLPESSIASHTLDPLHCNHVLATDVIVQVVFDGSLDDVN